MSGSRPRAVSGRCQIGQGTSAGAYSGDGLAPIPATDSSLARIGTGAASRCNMSLAESIN